VEVEEPVGEAVVEDLILVEVEDGEGEGVGVDPTATGGLPVGEGVWECVEVEEDEKKTVFVNPGEDVLEEVTVEEEVTRGEEDDDIKAVLVNVTARGVDVPVIVDVRVTVGAAETEVEGEMLVTTDVAPK